MCFVLYGGFNLLFQQRLHIHVPFRPPLVGEHVAESGRHKHQCRFAVRKASDHVGSPPDLPVQPLKGVVGPYLSPVRRREVVVAQRLSDTLFKRFGGSLQLHLLEADHDARSLLESAFAGFLREDRPKHSTNFFRFVRRNVLQHVPFEVITYNIFRKKV